MHGLTSFNLQDINWWQWSSEKPPLGWFIANFLLFVSGLGYFARKKVRAFFAHRHFEISKEIKDTHAIYERSYEAYQKYNQKLKNLAGEGDEVRGAQKAILEVEKAKLLQEVEAKEAQLWRDKTLLIQQEKQELAHKLTKQVLAQIMTEVRTQLRKDLTEKEHTELLSQGLQLLHSGNFRQELAKLIGPKG